MDGIMSPEEVAEGLKKLADLGALTEDKNPQTNQEQYGLPEDKVEAEEPKLLPIVKDLLKDNNSEPVGIDKIKEACDGKLNPKEVKDGLKKLVD